MREAYNKFENLGMLWSIDKDSTVLLWLARKAFLGHVPFPLVHEDTICKIPSMIEYRDKLVKEFTGISAPYEAPLTPELELPTHTLSLRESVAKIVEYLL